MISIIYDQRAMPVYFEFLPKLGSSNFAEQTKLISQVLPLFKKYKTILLGNREFCSVKLATWLREKEVCGGKLPPATLRQELLFCLRLKKNEFIKVKNGDWQQLNDLGLNPGVFLFLSGIKMTKTQKISGFNLAGKWQRKIGGMASKEGWFILTNLKTLELAIAAYKKRFEIEEMFRDFKSGGYNMEDTNVAGSRLISLILLITIAYSSATFTGQKIKSKGVQKYVGIKEYGRVQRRHSSFYIGLYGQNWVIFMADCWELVTELMKLSCNKIENYLKGMRAMKHILTAF